MEDQVGEQSDEAIIDCGAIFDQIQAMRVVPSIVELGDLAAGTHKRPHSEAPEVRHLEDLTF